MLLALAALFTFGLTGCDDAATSPTPDEGGALNDGLTPEGQDGKPTFGASGEPEQKADALQGARGIGTAYDDAATQVWKVTADWEEKDTTAARKAGMAWPADSGLTWNQKYSRWVDSMQKTAGEAGYYDTYTLTTPYGRSLPAPALECAESGMFLRALFASWYGLPFIMEGRTSGGSRLYLGHMGFRTETAKFSGTPDFKSVYTDYSSRAAQIAAGTGTWPSDTRLRGRKLAGGFDDEQPALGIADAHFGTYMDELVLNKRVGYFMMYLLAYFGSVNVADTRNTYNRKAESIRPGDLVLHRYGFTGIGHTLIVKEVTVSNGQYAVELMSGSMPRRQPDWEDANGSRYSLVYDAAGSSEDSGEGVYAKFGGGLKGWRIPKKANGKWAMTIAAAEQADWVDSTDLAAVGARVETFREILTTLTAEQKRAVILQRIQDNRDHLSRYPASCSARHRREEAFTELYAFEAGEGRTQAEVDGEVRTLADYVLADLVYEKSKTCCWNSSTSAMYEIILQKAQLDVADHTAMECREPTVFKAENGGFDQWKQFAESIGRGAEWKAWSEDEPCAQRGVQADTEAPAIGTDWCAVGTAVLGGDGDTFRVQLGAWSTLAQANEVVEFVNDWFAEHGRDSAVRAVFPTAPGIDVFEDATLYKVRLGQFDERADAQTALALVRTIRADLTAAGVVAE